MLQPLAQRSNPGQDLRVELDFIAQSRNIEAPCIVSCMGSLAKAVLPYVNKGKTDGLVRGFHHSLEKQIHVD